MLESSSAQEAGPLKRIHVIGRKNSGKTTLIVDLVKHLAEAGYRVGTIKHTHHHHELDTPGKDSHRHREAGATAVGILSPGMIAAFRPTDHGTQDRYDYLSPMFAGCDLVLVEGNSQSPGIKVEVWRAAVSEEPIAKADNEVTTLVTDDEVDVGAPVWPRSNIDAIVARLLELL